ncbi:CBN-SPR-5 protein [Caenorhabditis brenneri]|uniref:CBN-SPR-5 protein n=1 Tax=Caenorhabditis brenneri TaxID=135651 RepID=G0MIW7_CAEBE|nr:CBN-SPR-5 protein [Caenorhabditis brenneri]
MSSESGSGYLDEELRGEELGPMDENALSAAATRSCLPYDRPTEHELAFFPELWEHKTAVEVYLLIRNTTLATWHCNPLRECTVSDVYGNVYPPFNSDLELIQNIVNYLTRHAFINFGRYVRCTKISRFLVRDERKVIVIGAGAAGIAAATQLTSFGFDVTIVEGRNRIGGRAHGFRTKHGQLVETGADTLRNIENTPIYTLLQQANLDEHGAFDHSFCYVDGKILPEEKANLVIGHYHSAKGALNWQAHQNEHRDETGRFISRQQAYENLINMCERTTLIKYYNHCKSLESIARARQHHFDHMKLLRNMAFLAENELGKMEKDGIDDPLRRRSLKRDIATALEKFEEIANSFEACDGHWIRLTEQPAAKQYLLPGEDFSTYNFMLGFEEYLIGADLEKVQFTTDAVKNKENGVAARLTEGVQELLLRIVQRRDLDIRLKSRVTDIDYSGHDNVKVTILKSDGQVEELTAGFVVSTIPIGVLKKTIVSDEKAPRFNPPLPAKKVDAIRNIGNGLINKCILEFDRPFWSTNGRTQFITVQPNLKTRGSMSLWSSVPGSKVLTTYIVGQEAENTIPDDVIVQNAMLNLQKVFGSQCPRTPVSAHITRWQNDDLAGGSGAFMSLRTELHHFDDVRAALKTADGRKRVYFAGEHTCQEYTSTIQGAWISGARAATDIANDHNGIGFVDLTGNRKEAEEGEEMIEMDYDGPMPDDLTAFPELQGLRDPNQPGTSSSA